MSFNHGEKPRIIWFLACLLITMAGWWHDCLTQAGLLVLVLTIYAVISYIREQQTTVFEPRVTPWLILAMTLLAFFAAAGHTFPVAPKPESQLVRYMTNGQDNFALLETLETQKTVALLNIVLDHSIGGEHSEECTELDREHTGTGYVTEILGILRGPGERVPRLATKARQQLIDRYVTGGWLELQLTSSTLTANSRPVTETGPKDSSRPKYIFLVSTAGGKVRSMVFEVER